MATRWSSEWMVAEHPDLQASAMTVDWSGNYVLLAGRRFFGLKSMTEPVETLKKFPRQSKYDVGAAEWNPHKDNKELCAISTKDKVEIFDWGESWPMLRNTLSAHTRVVTDLNWHQFDPNQVASCSIDTYTYIWDLRDTRRPSISLSTIARATQVRWNKVSRYLLATAHSGDVKIWDQRKGVTPVQYITAHLANIYCLDWDPNQESRLATSSQDCSVKFFDVNNPKKPENVITAAAPVWRSRYTPFGNGMLMVIVPPMRRGDNSLLLWNLANKGPKSSPIHTFVGHTDVVLEFEWRKRPDSLDYQLITWSKDQTLRIWQIEPFLQKLCGIENENDPTSLEQHSATDLLATNNIVNSVESTVIVDGRNGTLEVVETVPPESDQALVTLTQPKTLHQEFSLVNVNIQNVTFDSMDPIKRRCTVTAQVEGHSAVVQIAFPLSYPNNTAPIFQFTSETSVDASVKNKLLKVLKQTAQQRVKKNRSCLEPCVRQLVKTLEELSVDSSEKTQLMHGSLLQPTSVYSSFQDVYIPYPRTSGAKFCSVGILVCFGRVMSGRQVSLRNEKKTPRSFSALNTYSESPIALPSYYYVDRHSGQSRPNRVSRGLSRGISQKGAKANIYVYDVSCLFPFQRDLAERYKLDSHDIVGMCQKNAQVAASLGRKDLGQVWSLAAIAATPALYDEDEDFPWPTHPLSIGMIHSIIAHYAEQSDVQTAAMLCCAFGRRTESQGNSIIKTCSKSVNASAGGSPYHTIHKVESSIEGWSMPLLKQNRSSSWSENLDELHSIPNIIEHSPFDTEEEKPSRVCLEDSWVFDEYKKAYAEILHRWYLLDAHAQVMKYISCSSVSHSGLEPRAECPSCTKSSLEPYCQTCLLPVLQCVICHTSVKGGANACIVCGHGGHAQHMMEWFSSKTECPSGCGCLCLIETATVLEP